MERGTSVRLRRGAEGDKMELKLTTLMLCIVSIINCGRPADAPASATVIDPDSPSSMTTGRSGHTATLLPDGKVLIAGGMLRNGVIHASAEIFDPKSNRFSVTGSMAVKRVGHTAELLQNGKVLIAGGWTDGGVSS